MKKEIRLSVLFQKIINFCPSFVRRIITPQIIMFCIAGTLSSILDMGTLFCLTSLGLNYLIGSVCGFIVGLISNYIFAISFVFNNQTPKFSFPTEFILYSLVGICGLGLTVLIMFFFTQILGLYFMLSKTIAILIVLIFNFTFKSILFK